MTKEYKVRKTKNTWLILGMTLIHFIMASLCSRSFFHSIRAGAGSELIAYGMDFTGSTLAEDMLARFLCKTYAYIVAFVIILAFWGWCFYLFSAWKKKLVKTKYYIALFGFIAVGIALIASVYPMTIVEATDTTWNYVLAKEWLPIYWHGFLTNVFHCACMIIFPHPIAMSIIPYLIAINGLCYLLYVGLVKNSNGLWIKVVLVVGFIVVCLPDAFMVLTYAGRNYSYGIFSVGYLGILLTDYNCQQKLSGMKLSVLTAYALILALWRGEGIFYLLFLPVLVYFTYFYKRNVLINWKKCLLWGE